MVFYGYRCSRELDDESTIDEDVAVKFDVNEMSKDGLELTGKENSKGV